MNLFFLTATFVLLAVLPLELILPLPSITHEALRLWDLLASILLGLFYFNVLVLKQARTYPLLILFCSVVTVLFLGASFAGSYPPMVTTVIRFLLAIWFLPLFHWLCVHYGNVRVGLVGIGILILHAQWGIGHFVVQRDFGLSPLGEVRISPLSEGIAKFRMLDTDTASGSLKLVRSYGPYTHANDYGGSVAIGYSMLSALFFIRSARSRHFASSSLAQYVFFLLCAYVLILGALFSFSRAVYLSLLMTSYFTLRSLTRVSLWRLMLCFLITLITLSPFFLARAADRDDTSIVERISGYQWSFALVSWRGVGPGNYPGALQRYFGDNSIDHHVWQVAPVHSVPLLLAAEWGIIAALFLAGLIAFFFGIFYPVNRSLVSILPLLLFDHYLLTHTAPMVWVVLLTVLARAQERKKAHTPVPLSGT